MPSSTSNIIESNSNNICSTLTDLSPKQNCLVKWLENFQFDVNNEWLGRLTAVSHSCIIDFDCDELKPGIEISVIRNNGEIWRAQVIIPKTSSNTIDLPPNSSKKISTKAMSCTDKTVIERSDALSSSLDQSGLLDFNDLSSNELGTTSVPVLTANTNNIVSVSDLNIETILKMQCDLLEQQKELKSIELDTMEQLKLLQQNISKLTRKFDSFETTCATFFSSSNGSSSDLKSVKNIFNKFNSSFKLVESELLKDYQPQHHMNNNNNSKAGPSSLSSSPATTTFTLTNHGDLNNHHHQLTESNNNVKTSNTTIVNLFQSSSSSSSTIHRIVKNKKNNDSNNENVYKAQPNITITSNKPTKARKKIRINK